MNRHFHSAAAAVEAIPTTRYRKSGEINAVTIGNAAEVLLHNISTAGQDGLRGHPGRGPTILQWGMHRLLAHAQEIGIVDDCSAELEETAAAQFRKVQPLCESPIESDLLAALLTGNWAFSQCKAPLAHDAKNYDEPFPTADVVIVPQMALLRYRLDLGIVIDRGAGKAIVGVECDGAAYHHDRALDATRDRYFRALGVPVIRVRGAEIFAEPTAMADLVIAAIEEWRSAA